MRWESKPWLYVLYHMPNLTIPNGYLSIDWNVRLLVLFVLVHSAEQQQWDNVWDLYFRHELPHLWWQH